MAPTTFALRFPRSQIRRLAARYPAAVDDDVLRVAAAARERGHLTKREFLILGEWKTPRSRKHRLKNSEDLVREATRLAFSTKHEELKITLLRFLDGVEWPTASVILHLCDPGRYPILDVRAFWSAGAEQRSPSYTFDKWIRFTEFTRDLSRATGCSMRDVDRALWQYSKEHQPDA